MYQNREVRLIGGERENNHHVLRIAFVLNKVVAEKFGLQRIQQQRQDIHDFSKRPTLASRSIEGGQNDGEATIQ
jgi:hypothetical protein